VVRGVCHLVAVGGRHRLQGAPGPARRHSSRKLVDARRRGHKPADIVARFTFDRHRILRDYRGGVKEGAMMLTAVETVTNAHSEEAEVRTQRAPPLSACSP